MVTTTGEKVRINCSVAWWLYVVNMKFLGHFINWCLNELSSLASLVINIRQISFQEVIVSLRRMLVLRISSLVGSIGMMLHHFLVPQYRIIQVYVSSSLLLTLPGYQYLVWGTEDFNVGSKCLLILEPKYVILETVIKLSYSFVLYRGIYQLEFFCFKKAHKES